MTLFGYTVPNFESDRDLNHLTESALDPENLTFPHDENFLLVARIREEESKRDIAYNIEGKGPIGYDPVHEIINAFLILALYRANNGKNLKSVKLVEECLSIANINQVFTKIGKEKEFEWRVRISLIYCLAQMNEKAFEWLGTAEESGKALKKQDSSLFVRLWHMIADIHLRNLMPDIAIEYLDKALELMKSLPTKETELYGWNHTHRATYYSIKGDQTGACTFYNLALKFREHDKRLTPITYCDLANFHANQNEFQKAFYYAVKALEVSIDFCPGYYVQGRACCVLGKIFYLQGSMEYSKVCYQVGIDNLDHTLPRGNNLSSKYIEEYGNIHGHVFLF